MHSDIMHEHVDGVGGFQADLGKNGIGLGLGVFVESVIALFGISHDRIV